MEVADDEWRSMLRFGLFTGQRLYDIATLRWAQIDLAREEIRLTAKKTGKGLTLPLAGPLLRHVLTLTQLQNHAFAALSPIWLRLPEAERYSGLRKSRLYELISAGEIRSDSTMPVAST
jgi:integrase